MLKLLRYLLIERKANNPLLSAQIYQMIYHPEISVQWAKSTISSGSKLIGSTSAQMKSSAVTRDNHQGNMVLTERQEIEQALRELQSKPKKTVADRTSIGMLEAVLTNM